MTKLDLLHEIDLAIANDACLMLKAGDYFTDYLKIIHPRNLRRFEAEVIDFGVEENNIPNSEDNFPVEIHSIDITHCGTGERNEYYIFDAKPILSEEIRAIASLVNFKI